LLETYPDTAAWVQSNQIASLVLSPALPDLVSGATHYHADYVNPYWANTQKKVAQVGRHIFYQ
jgi:spore germination cell wall hydrolase CwlJ-like protein